MVGEAATTALATHFLNNSAPAHLSSLDWRAERQRRLLQSGGAGQKPVWPARDASFPEKPARLNPGGVKQVDGEPKKEKYDEGVHGKLKTKRIKESHCFSIVVGRIVSRQFLRTSKGS